MTFLKVFRKNASKYIEESNVALQADVAGRALAQRLSIIEVDLADLDSREGLDKQQLLLRLEAIENGSGVRECQQHLEEIERNNARANLANRVSALEAQYSSVVPQEGMSSSSFDLQAIKKDIKSLFDWINSKSPAEEKIEVLEHKLENINKRGYGPKLGRIEKGLQHVGEQLEEAIAATQYIRDKQIDPGRLKADIERKAREVSGSLLSTLQFKVDALQKEVEKLSAVAAEEGSKVIPCVVQDKSEFTESPYDEIDYFTAGLTRAIEKFKKNNMIALRVDKLVGK